MSTRTVLVVRTLLLSACLSATPAFAQNETASEVESFEAIKKEYDEASKVWMDSYRKASRAGASKEEIQKIIKARPTGAAYADRAIKVLEANATTEEGAKTAVWLIRAARVSGAPFARSLEILRTHHLNSASLKDVMLTLSRNPSPGIAKFLRTVQKKSESTENQGRACFTLAEHLKAKAAAVHKIKAGDTTAIKRYTETYGRQAVEVLGNANPTAIEKRAGKRYEEVIKTEAYAALDYYRGTIGDKAKSSLFELRNLSIGKTAPDIIGEDIDGTPMKLSDYRGKVVVLDFWGDW